MKQIWKRLVSLLLCLVMVASLLPAQSRAQEMVYLIENEEDFLAIPDNPEASFKLMADLDLGTLERPIGAYFDEWWGGSWGMKTFSGSLDGNGHTIRYSMNAQEDETEYGLFGDITDAEIFNLTLDVDMDLFFDALPQDCYVSPFGWAENTSFGGVTVTGRISVDMPSNGGSLLYLAGLSCGDSGGAHTAVECDVDLDITAVAPGSGSEVHYSGFFTGSSAVYNSSLSGEVELKCEGPVYIRQLINAQDCAAIQNLWVDAGYINAYGIHGGSDNVLMADYDLNSKSDTKACGIYASDGSSFYGNISCTGNTSGGLCGAEDCNDVYVEANLNCTNDSVTGLVHCTNSTFTGSLDCSEGGAWGAQSGGQNQVLADVTGGDSAVALSDETRSYAQGTVTSRSHSVGIFGGSYGGLHYYNTFVGSVTATGNGAGGTYAVGSQNDYSIVHADIYAQTGGESADAYGVPDHSYFTGSVTGSNVRGIGSNSYGSATIRGDDGSIAGQNSYFTGDVTFENVTGGVTLSELNSIVVGSVKAWVTNYADPVADVGVGSAGIFVGSATVYAGEVNWVSMPGDANVVVHTDNLGTWNSQAIRENGVWFHGFEEYNYRSCDHTQQPSGQQ